MSDSFVTPWTVTHQSPLSVRFPRQNYWSGLPFASPGDLPDPGIEHASPALAGRFFTTEPPGKPKGMVLSIVSDCLCTEFRNSPPRFLVHETVTMCVIHTLVYS